MRISAVSRRLLRFEKPSHSSAPAFAVCIYILSQEPARNLSPAAVQEE
eukprot:SAG31_NODE_45704_length_257_cov_2.588608_1_plen_47_part_10